MSKVSVIGSGAWGTTLSILVSENGHDARLWVYERDLEKDLREVRENKRFLPGYQLPSKIEISSNLESALENSDIIIFAIPTQFLRNQIKKIKMIPKDSLLISAAKGIELETFKRPSQIIGELLKRDVSVLSGPNLAKEVVKGLPAASVIASKDIKTAEIIQNTLFSERFRVYSNDDVIGVELGGAIKNIIAIAAGIGDGLKLGENARAALIVRGISEIARLGKALGGREKTFYGLSGIGDMLLTCSSSISRNHNVGFRLGQGEKLKDITSNMTAVAEGIATTKAVHKLSQRMNIDMPITKETYSVLYAGADPLKALSNLLNRKAKAED